MSGCIHRDCSQREIAWRYIWNVWLIRSSASHFPEERSFLLMEAVEDIREQI